ncbi:hypothetical protein FQA47_024903 [Oryzias melastigma]|uniref:Uncharacterized protein n=1 Tax=Oryzias melastigma TaxID=30732 RepID=A0A834FP24_ORYME|nr:hypothetical protein FQA47_024903 [Oryzias melastigma]
MVVNNSPKAAAEAPLDKDMEAPELSIVPSHNKGARRKGRFKGSDGSTSSDTTTNSLVRQDERLILWSCPDTQGEYGGGWEGWRSRPVQTAQAWEL